MPPPPPDLIAVDVDGTLLMHDGTINRQVVDWCRHQSEQGHGLMLWSSAGQAHAEEAAMRAGIGHLFGVIISKPGFVLDDQGWGWIRFTGVVRDIEEMDLLAACGW